MRKSTAILSVASLGLAACAGYLAYELKAARDALARNDTAVPPTSGSLFGQPMNADIAPPVPAPAPGASSPVPASRDSLEDQKARWRASRVAQIASLRALVEDPEKHAAQISNLRRGYRRDFPRLADRLGLSGDQYSGLTTLLAEQQMRHTEASYRCAVKPACDPKTAAAGLKPIDDRELADLLGAERLRQFATYQDNIQERRVVEAMRGVLPDAQALSDAQADKLIDSLGDVRRQYSQELEQSGAVVTTSFSIYGGVLVPSTAIGVEQKYAAAVEFQRRQREVAAQVLSAAQLEEFTRRQEDMLDNMRSRWEYEEQSGPH